MMHISAIYLLLLFIFYFFYFFLRLFSRFYCVFLFVKKRRDFTGLCVGILETCFGLVMPFLLLENFLWLHKPVDLPVLLYCYRDGTGQASKWYLSC